MTNTMEHPTGARIPAETSAKARAMLPRHVAVKVALDEVKASQERARTVIHRLYPVGSDIKWERGGHIQYGVVIFNGDHGSGDSFRVRNERTHKEYWITFYDVECAHQ